MPMLPETLIRRALAPLKQDQYRIIHDYVGRLLSSGGNEAALRALWLNSGAEFIVVIDGKFRPFLDLVFKMTSV